MIEKLLERTMRQALTALLVLLMSASYGGTETLRTTTACKWISRPDQMTVESLMVELDSPHALCRSAAARELGLRKAMDAAAKLRDRISDPVEFVRLAAASALADLGDALGVSALRELADVAQKDRSLATRAAFELCKRGHDSELAWTALQDKARPGNRMQAVFAISHLPDKDSRIRSLELAVRDPDANVRLAAAVSAGRERSVEVLPILRILGGDSDRVVRNAAVRSAVNTGVNEAIPLLVEMLRDTDHSVVSLASFQLARVAGPLAPAPTGDSKPVERWQKWWDQNRMNYPPGGHFEIASDRYPGQTK